MSDKMFPIIPTMATGIEIQTALIVRMAGITETAGDKDAVSASAAAEADD